VDKHTIKGILAKYSPPLSPSQMDEIAEAVVAEWSKTEKQMKAELKKKSKSSRVTRRRG
jgi:pyruvoyl-dependent arginine decarboxylase (PvlArgDC)